MQVFLDWPVWRIQVTYMHNETLVDNSISAHYTKRHWWCTKWGTVSDKLITRHSVPKLTYGLYVSAQQKKKTTTTMPLRGYFH